MQTSFVTIASFETAPSAWILKNRLACLGLNPSIADEHTVNTYWLYSSAIGGVKVQIPLSELSKYQSLLKECYDFQFPLFDDENDESLSKCPECDSIEVTVTKWNKRLIMLLWMILGVPLPIFGVTTICSDCGFEEHPNFDIPKQFRIIHLLILTTIVALMLGISMQLGYDWLKTISNPATP